MTKKMTPHVVVTAVWQTSDNGKKHPVLPAYHFLMARDYTHASEKFKPEGERQIWLIRDTACKAQDEHTARVQECFAANCPFAHQFQRARQTRQVRQDLRYSQTTSGSWP